MSSLSIAQFDRLPTIGALLGTQGHKEVLDQINAAYGSSSFFGSAEDPYANQHNFFINKIVEPIRIVATQFKQQFKEIMYTNENVIRPITSVSDLETYGIPECMWNAVAMHPIIRKFGEQHRVDLFGMDTKHFPKENVYDRLIHNGEVTLYYDQLKENNGQYTVHFDNRSTDPDLDDDEIECIRATYEFIDLFYSDLDKIYVKTNKKHILNDKSYLSEGVQFRDLDITAFPDKKG